jgi:hypothetical protein
LMSRSELAQSSSVVSIDAPESMTSRIMVAH